MKNQEMAAPVEMAQERDEADGLRQERGEGGTGDTHARHGPPTKNEQRIQRDVDDHRQQHEIERCLGVPGASQHRHHEGVHVDERQREKDHPHVVDREGQRIRGRAHGGQQALAHRQADDGHHDREGGKKSGARTHDPLRLGNVIRTDALADENGRRHGDTEGRADQQEHNRVGVRRRRERGLAEEAPHPDGVHRAIEGLQDVREQDR